MAELPIFSDQTIVQYLLGVLPEAEMEQLEEQSVCDPVFFERVQMAEDDLIRQFLDRELSPADENLFRRKYLTIPSLLSKVEFAQELRRVAREESRRRRLRIRWPAWPRLIIPVLATATAIVLVGVYWGRQGPSTANSARTQSEAHVSPGGFVSMLLLPGMEKGVAGRDRRIMIAPDTREIRLDLQVPGSDAPNRAEIDVTRVSTPDEQRAVQTIDSVPVSGGRLFHMTLKPADLPDGSYIAYLRRWPAAANSEPAATFIFSVGREASASRQGPAR
jgi:hypothetical protein